MLLATLLRETKFRLQLFADHLFSCRTDPSAQLCLPSSCRDCRWASLTRFATDTGGIIEDYSNHTSALRFEGVTTFVRYLTNDTDPHVYAVGSLLSTDYIVT